MTARAAQNAVRAHGAIENKRHWGLDGVMREDFARNRTEHGAHNFALLRHRGTHLLRNDKTNRHSLKVRRKQAAWSTDYLAHGLGQ